MLGLGLFLSLASATSLAYWSKESDTDLVLKSVPLNPSKQGGKTLLRTTTGVKGLVQGMAANHSHVYWTDTTKTCIYWAEVSKPYGGTHDVDNPKVNTLVCDDDLSEPEGMVLTKDALYLVAHWDERFGSRRIFRVHHTTGKITVVYDRSNHQAMDEYGSPRGLSVVPGREDELLVAADGGVFKLFVGQHAMAEHDGSGIPTPLFAWWGLQGEGVVASPSYNGKRGGGLVTRFTGEVMAFNSTGFVRPVSKTNATMWNVGHGSGRMVASVVGRVFVSEFNGKGSGHVYELRRRRVIGAPGHIRTVASDANGGWGIAIIGFDTLVVKNSTSSSDDQEGEGLFEHMCL